jgi:hypothetical protein
MLRKRREAAQAVANRLIAAENAIDRALICTADLSGTITQAHVDANLATEIGQTALEQASDTFVTLVKARRNIIETHQRLADARDRIGLREVGLGGLMDKPPLAAQPGHLSVVQNDTAAA